MAKKKSSKNDSNCHLGEQCKLEKHHVGECNPQPEFQEELVEENNEGDE